MLRLAHSQHKQMSYIVLLRIMYHVHTFHTLVLLESTSVSLHVQTARQIRKHVHILILVFRKFGVKVYA